MPWEGYAEHEHIDDSRTEYGALDCSLRGGGIVRYVPDGRRLRDVGRGSFRILGRTETLPLKHLGRWSSCCRQRPLVHQQGSS